MRVSGLILAGGQGRRMQGKDKGWVQLGDKPLIEWVIDRLNPQVDNLIINANRSIESYQQLNYPIIQDELSGYQGPLAGILAGLEHCQTELMVCVPCDTPFFPENLVAKMLEKHIATHANIVSVSDGERSHPVFAMIKTELRSSLNQFLQAGQRKIDRWYQQHNYQFVDYLRGEHFFENINTVEQLKAAELRIVKNER